MIQKQLTKDELDVIFTIYACVKDLRDVECVHIKKNTLQIAVPSDHPFADREIVSLSEMNAENYVMMERRISPMTVDYFVQLCLKNGFSPHAVNYVTDIETALRLVKLGKGVTILNMSRGVQIPEGIHVLDIEGAQFDTDLDYVVAFKRNNPNIAIPLFVSNIMDLTDWSSV